MPLVAAALAAAAIGASAAGADSSATSLTLAASADSFTNSGHSTTPYGTTTDFRAGQGSGTDKIAYLRFAVPADAASRIKSATLSVTRTAHHLPSSTISARSVAGSWSEGSLTAANAPKTGAVLDTEQTNSSVSTVSFDVTSAAAGQTSFSVGLTSPTSDVDIFNSKESGSAAPKLVLTLKPTASAPVSTPPASTPPASTPPASTPPASTPPASTPPASTPPASPPPASTPPASSPPAGGSPKCSISAKLVSSCQVWFGDTPQAYSHKISSQAGRLPTDESYTDRKFDIFHEYFVNGQLFPDSASISAADQGRLLSINWKPATDMTWADVAAGKADNRIDAEAAYLKSHFDRPFLLGIYHEPEDNVDLSAGSGMTPADYVAMYRHTVLRLRADGATKFVSVMNYMGFYRWNSIRDAMYPGDDVVDWIAWDPYMFNPGTGAGKDFASMLNQPYQGQLGMYDWAVKEHPGKPLMLAEWGAFDDHINTAPDGPAQFYSDIPNEMKQFPALKAIDYFTMNQADVAAGKGTEPTETSAGLAAWKKLAQNPMFNGPGISYRNNAVVAG
jgi:hypothetical protein